MIRPAQLATRSQWQVHPDAAALPKESASDGSWKPPAVQQVL